ncbi:hypothetical protein L218DRAFT_998537 [Marasmius fiardii PR-910]|nr:hypothetical protein L218DRAFT_998537 [Marasmius fiardii PR-910]
MRTAALVFKLSALVTAATAVHLRSSKLAHDPSGASAECITASSNTTGAAVIMQMCSSADDFAPQHWDFIDPGQNVGPQPLRIFGDKCLDVTDGNNADGTKLQIWTCIPESTNQLWIQSPLSDLTYQWTGTNKCIDLTDGSAAEEFQLQIWTLRPQQQQSAVDS